MMFRKYLLKIQRRREEADGIKNLLLHTSIALMLTSGLSYAVGLVRDKIFAYRFGASGELDVYNASFTVPDLFLALFVTGALLAAFVPIFTGLDEKSRKKASGYANQILSFGIVVLLGVGVVFGVALPWIVDLLVPGFSVEQKEQYVLLTRLMLLSPLIFTVSNTFGSMLISVRGFLWYGLAPVFYNCGIIFGAVVLSPKFGLVGLTLGTLLGVLLHMSVRLVPVLKYGWRPKFNFLIDENFKETVVLMLPKIVQLGMWQVLLIWFVRLASGLPEWSVTISSFSRNFQSVPVSLIGIAIALAAFSDLSRLAAEKKWRKFKKMVRVKGLRILAATGAAALALALISRYVIEFFLGGGAFTQEAVILTASMLAVYCISVPLESLMHLLARAHYALKNTLRPSVIHVVAILVIIGGSAWGVGEIGIYAIPVSFAVGLSVQIGLLWGSLRGLVT